MKYLKLGLVIFAVIVTTAGAYLWTPGRQFDAQKAIEAAAHYDARIIRDRFGVPHIYAKRDADVAFGLAYAHAEDDWETLEEVLYFARGRLGEREGRTGAVTDYLVAALNVWSDIDAHYESALTPETRALLDGYAAGLNLWCAEERQRCAPGLAPITGQDVVAGFVARTPFFYGLDEELTALFRADEKTHAAAEQARQAFLRLPPGEDMASNAIAVAPSRSADGHTRLMVNSHQPYTGPVAWYETRVKSDEGWDMIGGIFPGAPIILHGVGPTLGWAFTVNKPDLVDVYALDVDNAKHPKQYRFDGGWSEFERSTAKFRVKLFGPFSLPVSRPVLRTVHGPAFVTPGGVFAVSYGGEGDIRAVEQWRQLNKATNYESWAGAMRLQGIPSFNVVYADKTGKIAFFYNAAIPVRSSDQDWSEIADGALPDLVWKGVRPFGSAPSVIGPASGYVVSANHSPFKASGEADNPDPANFPAYYGIDERTPNRGYRIQSLYGGDPSITEEEFIAYKMDAHYAEDSRLGRLIRTVLADEGAAGDPDLKEPLAVLASWDWSASRDSAGAALATRFGRIALGRLLDGAGAETPDPQAALKQAAAELKTAFGRIDPRWSEVMRLQRGSVSLPVDGGPDTLRAVYPESATERGGWTAAGGDTYIIYADWAADGTQEIRTIHQFGSATRDPLSPHYADQAPLFAGEQWKSPPMALDALLAEATADYRPGKD